MKSRSHSSANEHSEQCVENFPDSYDFETDQPDQLNIPSIFIFAEPKIQIFKLYLLTV